MSVFKKLSKSNQVDTLESTGQLLKLFAVYDSKVEAFGTPFPSEHSGHVLREMESVVLNKDHAYGKYPADYTLFEIATYHTGTGIIQMYEAKKSIINLLELQTQVKPKEETQPTNNS